MFLFILAEAQSTQKIDQYLSPSHISHISHFLTSSHFLSLSYISSHQKRVAELSSDNPFGRVLSMWIFLDFDLSPYFHQSAEDLFLAIHFHFQNVEVAT